MITEAPAYHFSVDDVFTSLLEVADRRISLFDHPFFALLRRLHERFHTRVDLYLFYQSVMDGMLRTLAELPDGLRRDFGRAPWLRLGPHALDYDTPPHSQTPAEQMACLSRIYTELDRFAGQGQRSRWLRLHYFSETYEIAPFLRDCGVEALLLTDKDAVAYRLSEPERRRLAVDGQIIHNGLRLVRSHTRLENLHGEHTGREAISSRFDETIRRHGGLVLFTHEIDLANPEVADLANICMEELAAKAVPSL